MRIKTLIAAVLALGAGLLGGEELSLRSRHWHLPQGTCLENGILTVESAKPVKTLFATCFLPVMKLSGKICLLKGEYRGEKVENTRTGRFGGGVNLREQTGGNKRKYFPSRVMPVSSRTSTSELPQDRNEIKWKYFSFPLPAGACNWSAFQFCGAVSPNTKRLDLSCSLQNASGKTEFRNMKLRILGTPVPLGAAANMGWTDEIAHDGKGGWTDAGPENDGRYLERTVQREVLFNGYPFSLNTGAKSLLVMNQPEHFPQGPKTVSLYLQNPLKACYLYILHTAARMTRNAGDIARITVTCAAGEKQKFTLRKLCDLVDCTHCEPAENAKIAVCSKSASTSTVALYASRFAWGPEAGSVWSIRLETLSGGPVWIIASLTLSNKDFVKAEKHGNI